MLYFNEPRRKFIHQKFNFLDDFGKLIESGSYIKGDMGRELEVQIKQYLNVDFFSGCANGTDAITISLMASGITKGSKVLIPAMTAQASVVAVIRAGMVPVFVDVNSQGLIDVDTTEQAIKLHNPAAVLVVHLYGLTASLELIRKCQENEIVVIEDCAQAFGSKFSTGEYAGTVGDFGAHSFYPTKNLSTIGDAGGISIKNADKHIGQVIKSTAEYGWNNQREVIRLGFNSRIDEIHCSIISNQLKDLSKQSRSKKETCKTYLDGMRNHYAFTPMASNAEVSRCQLHLFSVCVKEPKGVDEYFRKRGVILGRHYDRPLPYHKKFTEFDFIKTKSKSNASEIAKTQRSLPFFPYLLNQEIELVMGIINEYPS